MNIVVAPQIIRRIEDNMQYIVVSHWARREQDLWWRRLVKTRTSSTKRELVQWMLETAKIQPMGEGGNLSYDDLAEVMHEIVVEKFGSALRLSEEEIEDGAAFDRAGKWARQVSGSGVCWPQEQAAQLLRDGKTNLAYDNVSFFNTAHPINPVIGASGGVYANLHYDMPFSAANLAKAYASIAQIKSTDGKYRKLKPKVVAAGEIERLAVTQALTAEFFSDPVAGGTTAPATNVVKTQYGFEEPIISADFDETASIGDPAADRGVWYLACELMEDDELGGLIFSERKAFSMNSYSALDDVDLARMDAFEWQFKGRNASTYGHPFLLHRFEPGEAP